MLIHSLLAGLALATPVAPQSVDAHAESIPGLAEAIADELGTEQYRVVALDLPASPPERFAVDLPGTGGVRIELKRHSVRDPLFGVQVWNEATGYMYVEPGPVRTYRGRVAGRHGETITASLLPDGLLADAHTNHGASWGVYPVAMLVPGTAEQLHVVYRTSHDREMPLACGSADTPQALSLDGIAVDVLGTGPCQQVAEVAYDADFEYYQDRGSDVDATIALIEAHTNTVNLFYERDIRITHVITEIVVRTSVFYTPTGGGNLLDLFRAEWNGPLSGTQRDMAHLMTGKPGSLIEYGGLAYVGVVCNRQWAYGWSMDGANIVGHELGHNWGAGHCHDTDPCNNMCGACYYIGPNTKKIKQAYISGINCLDTINYAPTPVAPYASPDTLTVRKDEYDSLGTVELDVLLNDEDGNCQPLFLHSFDTVTPQGGTVARLANPSGRDRLLYTPPSDVFIGVDRFEYAVKDNTGLRSTGTVRVLVHSVELIGYWDLDENAGTTAADKTPGRKEGSFVDAPAWVPGVIGSGLEFDGSDDSVAIPPLNLNSNTVTITTWIKRDGQQGNFKGIVFSRDSASAVGMHYGTGNGLRYTWNDDADTFNWNTGLSLPDGQWVFAALVVEPDKATMYCNDGTMRSSVLINDHAPAAWDGVVQLGWDSTAANRHMKGCLDDVRIYNYSLSEAELLDIIALGNPADAPRPVDGGTMADPVTETSWVANLDATSHDVYFGTTYAGVRDATPSDGEFQGNQAGTSFTPVGLVAEQQYFWRVDEHTTSGIIKGRIWQFTPPLWHHWQLDETSGSVAADSAAGLDGSFEGATIIGQPGATAQTGNSITLNSAPDRVLIPAMNLNTSTVTFTAWVRRDGAQADYSGILFTRQASTTAGLNVAPGNKLGYHWENNQWWWDTGLVLPDGGWVFAALVVEPDRATIYMGDGGVLSSAVNFATHPLEEFDGAFTIGRDALSGARTFDGDVDDARIYNAALSPADIQDLYDATR